MREQQPEAFDPYRWLRPEAKAFTESYIPFSLGSRACVGKGRVSLLLLESVGE
jgi:benzoate 4-monooxygenase